MRKYRIGPASAIIAVLALALSPAPPFPLDDVYITLHNTRSLIAGADPLYGVDPLVGATSAVHLALLALAGLVLPLPNAALLICLTGAALYAAGLCRFGPGVTFIGLAASFVPIHLINGLETSLAMAAVIWSIHLADVRRLPFLAGLMPFIRPELGLLAALLLARRLWITRQWLDIGIAAAVAAPWGTWTWLATGLPFPNTMGAERSFSQNTPTR